MSEETPTEPSTWRWTEADKLFLKVLDEFHAREIRVIIDYSWSSWYTLRVNTIS